MNIGLATISLPKRTAIYWDASWILRNNYGGVEHRRRALRALSILARRDPSEHLRRAAGYAVSSLGLDMDILLLPHDESHRNGPERADHQDGAA